MRRAALVKAPAAVPKQVRGAFGLAHSARAVRGLSDGSPSTAGVAGHYSGGWDAAEGRPEGAGSMAWDNGILCEPC